MSPESVLADLERVLDAARREDRELKASLALSERPAFFQERPFHMDARAPIVRTVAEAHAKVKGRSAVVGTLIPQVFFGTDASHILAAGIPRAIYGPGKVTDISTPNESMAVADMITAARVYLQSALDICGREGGVS